MRCGRCHPEHRALEGQLDRGADFYNHTPIRFDAIFLVNRLVLVLAGLGAVGLAQRQLTRRTNTPKRQRVNFRNHVLACRDTLTLTQRARKMPSRDTNVA